jgi:hypothetical protein
MDLHTPLHAWVIPVLGEIWFNNKHKFLRQRIMPLFAAFQGYANLKKH